MACYGFNVNQGNSAPHQDIDQTNSKQFLVSKVFKNPPSSAHPSYRLEMDVSMLQSQQKHSRSMRKLAVWKGDIEEYKEIFDMINQQKEVSFMNHKKPH